MTERDIFTAAVQLADGERAAYLAAACGGRPDLRAQVEELLRLHAGAGDFLERPPAAPDETRPFLPGGPDGPGDAVGPYKLLEAIGEGGMGTVYAAEQAHPVRRKVAVKLVKAGMDSQQVLARFEQERHALALMDHPNIARVLDAGTTDQGRPYFVMELVRGLAVTDYCDRARLPVADRLRVFADVCRAVQHAHMKGVIHRDLKPSNVLVTVVDGRPVPKVIDFGIAKATAGSLADSTLHTGHFQLVGTPLYMSPEQAELAGVDVDTRSDVYSLGVLLYELLTGTTPFDPETLRAAGLDEVRRIVREDDPPRPSRRVSTLAAGPASTVAGRRGVDAGRLGRVVRGELDWVVMRALEKDRGRRYQSPAELAADVDRYLARGAVQAAPPSALYHARKFARRNRPQLLAGVAVVAVLTILVAGGGYMWSDRTARQASVRLRVADAMREADGHRAEGHLPEATSAARRAGVLLADGGDPVLVEAVGRVLADLTLAAALEQVRLDKATSADHREPWRVADAAYAATFQAFGIDIDGLSAGEAAERVRERSVRAELVAALDDWLAQRVAARAADDRPCRHLLAVCRAVDPDEWRGRLRDARVRRDRGTLEELAAGAAVDD